ncbi:unnamed protein product [Sphagnum balticum]
MSTDDEPVSEGKQKLVDEREGQIVYECVSSVIAVSHDSDWKKEENASQEESQYRYEETTQRSPDGKFRDDVLREVVYHREKTQLRQVRANPDRKGAKQEQHEADCLISQRVASQENRCQRDIDHRVSSYDELTVFELVAEDVVA